MDFIDRLKTLSGSAHARVPHTRTEEATKTALVMPFLQVLGYDVFDPREVVPEYVADVGLKRGEKVDYAVLKDGKPIMQGGGLEARSCQGHTTLPLLRQHVGSVRDPDRWNDLSVLLRPRRAEQDGRYAIP